MATAVQRRRSIITYPTTRRNVPDNAMISTWMTLAAASLLLMQLEVRPMEAWGITMSRQLMGSYLVRHTATMMQRR